MSKKLISMRLDEALLERLDLFAHSAGTTRTDLFEEMAAALLEGRLGVVPRDLHDSLLPLQPLPGCSSLYPAYFSTPEGSDEHE